MRTRPTPRDVLGVPALPPPALSAGVSRLRGMLGRLHRSTAPPPVQVLDALFGMLEHRVLVALCSVGVPDALTGPRTVGDLARDVGADPDLLERLVRFGATRGWLRIDRRGRVRPTRVTAFLRADHPGGWRSWVDFAGGAEVVAAVAELSAEAANPFQTVNGAPFFEWMAEHDDRWAVFDEAMAAGGRMHALTLAHSLDWSGCATICDVGGGTGALLAALLELVPGATGTLLDLPGVAARAVDHPRMSVVAGDAFTTVPDGHHTYLLVNVIHDWGDDDSVSLLRAVAAADPRRVVVVEGERSEVPTDDIAASTDVLMAALTPGGRERTASQIDALATAAGLRTCTRVRLASGDLASVLVAA
ncbi:methyltransferase [Dermatobacter hominis]|uniref:methyltransferase n=1 Tax=Dermatobacter hominis TaxID=2884263 RepID=UPI001D0F970D|nr:methyltransferase [Dermatobacter hominis]UDY37653.1 hypothetical protein LH044_08955 [Dermatobacter hominis]